MENMSALLHSIWRHTGHQYPRLRHDSISGCQPSTDSSATSAGHIMVVGRSLSLTVETSTRRFLQATALLRVYRLLMYAAD